MQHTGFKRKRGNVDDDFGMRLEDDKEHPNWTRNVVEVEVVV